MRELSQLNLSVYEVRQFWLPIQENLAAPYLIQPLCSALFRFFLLLDDLLKRYALIDPALRKDTFIEWVVQFNTTRENSLKPLNELRTTQGSILVPNLNDIVVIANTQLHRSQVAVKAKDGEP